MGPHQVLSAVRNHSTFQVHPATRWTFWNTGNGPDPDSNQSHSPQLRLEQSEPVVVLVSPACAYRDAASRSLRPGNQRILGSTSGVPFFEYWILADRCESGRKSICLASLTLQKN